MLRSATIILAALLWCTQALAVSEADRRNCTVTGDAKGRIEHALYNVRATGHVGRVRTLLHVD